MKTRMIKPKTREQIWGRYETDAERAKREAREEADMQRRAQENGTATITKELHRRAFNDPR